MDDILGHLETALWSFLGKAADFCLELAGAAGRKGLELAAVAAGWIAALAAKIAAVPLWLSLPVAVFVLALVAVYLLRQRLYDRVLVYHLVWLRRRGYGRQTFRVRRGAVRQTRQFMARPVPLPGRFSGIAVYEVESGQYGVAYGVAGGFVEDVRLYRRDLRAGLRAMGEDVAAYFRANVRMLRADSELRAFFCRARRPGPGFRGQPGGAPRRGGKNGRSRIDPRPPVLRRPEGFTA